VNEIMPILLFLSTESLWFQESKAWSEWTMSGPMESSFRREYIGENHWRFVTSDKQVLVQLSKDRQDVVSISMNDATGKGIELQSGMEMWYTPQARIEKPVIKGTEECASQFGTKTCRIAEHTDEEGNQFRWYLLEDVPGGVLQFDANFDGKAIQFHMKKFELKR